MIEYVEQSETNPNGELVRITEEEAIRRAKAVAATKGHTYASDAEALGDFMVCYWANRYVTVSELSECAARGCKD